MSTVEIRICMGTACYVLGAASLMQLTDSLAPDLAERVAIEGVPCLDLCKRGQFGKAPFVCVGDRVIAEATVPKLIDEIKRQAGVSAR